MLNLTGDALMKHFVPLLLVSMGLMLMPGAVYAKDSPDAPAGPDTQPSPTLSPRLRLSPRLLPNLRLLAKPRSSARLGRPSSVCHPSQILKSSLTQVLPSRPLGDQFSVRKPWVYQFAPSLGLQLKRRELALILGLPLKRVLPLGSRESMTSGWSPNSRLFSIRM